MATPTVAKKQKTGEGSSAVTSEPNGSSQQMDITRLGLNNQRLQGNNCDIFIVCGDDKLPAHRVVLRAGSVYFDAMFASGLEEASSTEVSLPTVSKKSMAIILDSLYLQRVNIDTLPVEETLDLLSAAHLLQVNPVVEICVEELRKNINDDNWDKLLQEAVTFTLDSLVTAAVYYLHHYENWAENDKIRKLGFDSFYAVITILSNDIFNSADLLVNLILDWVGYREDRKEHLLKLFSSIDVSSASNEVLTSLINDNCLIKNSFEVSYLLLTKIGALFNNPQTVKTESSYPKLLMFLSHTVLSYDLLQRDWFEYDLFSNTVPKVYSGMAVADDAVYFTAEVPIVQGQARSGTMFVLAFNLSTNTASKIMTCARKTRFGMVYLNDALWFTGGYSFINGVVIPIIYLGNFCLKCYVWKNFSQPLIYRIDPQVVVARDKLLAFGGRNRDGFVRDVERYCPTTNQWTVVSVVPDLNSDNFTFTVVPCLSKIYLAVCDETNEQQTKLMEFDPEPHSWKDITIKFKIPEFGTLVDNWMLHGSTKPLPFLVIEQNDKFYRMDPRNQQCILITRKQNWAENGHLVVFA